MYEDVRTISIGQQEYPAVFNTAAFEEVTRRYGGLTELGDAMKDPANAISEVAWIIALVTAQGAALKRLQEGSDIKTYSADEIKILISPKELMAQVDLVIEIINTGMGEDEADGQTTEVDEVLEEIEASKKEPGAGD
jgi:hypothetical protein